MKEMDSLIDIAEVLMGPSGCPWDAKQNFRSLQKHFLEEVSEVVEAIDEQDFAHIEEELGDVFYLVLFAAKIAEKQGLFSLKNLLIKQKEKLIRRHPHVFDKESKKNISIEELEKNWDRIKKEENRDKKPKNIFESIPKSMPLLQAAQKILRKLAKDPNFSVDSAIASLESDFQKKFFFFLYKEVLEGQVDAEGELRRGMQHLQKEYAVQQKIPPEKT